MEVQVRITSVINQKGGVGKTALSVGLAGALAEAGQRVLLVDLDPQGHATAEALQLPEASGQATLAGALSREYTGPTSALAVRHWIHESGGSIDVWPNSQAMFLVSRQLDLGRSRELQVRRLLADVDGTYDHVVLDCPPALDALTDNALAATDGILIPLLLDPSMLRALKLLMDQIESLEAQVERKRPIEVHGLVPSAYRRPLSNLATRTQADLKRLGVPMLAHLPLAVVVPEAWHAGVPLTAHAPDHEHSTALRSIAALLMEASA
ncbi:ParA family protein [Amycolatopsis antarctica]|uniref:ParA family protein n=1 Tax=Amycolatopsis antarctica TaxID=1854586 RepID=UPI0013FE3CBD|nr:ParA family protein [Amycolatopsis antarctica]